MSRLLNILFVTPRYRPAVGGAEFHLAAVSDYLAARGHAVTVATTTALDIHALWSNIGRHVTAGREVSGNLTIERFPVRTLPGGDLSYRILRRGVYTLRHFPATAALLANQAPHAPRLGRWLAELDGRWDVIVGFNIAYEGLMRAAAHTAQRLNRPFVAFPLTHLGAGEKPGHDAVGRYYTMPHQQNVVRTADLLVAQTPSEAAFYQESTPTPQETIVVGPGIDLREITGGVASEARQKFSVTGPLILLLGAGSIAKGTADTIQAAHLLWRSGLDFDLVVAGHPGPDLTAWLNHQPRDEFQSRLHLLGPVSEEDKRNLLAACNSVVMPSQVDSFGIVYLEAWAYGRPVIGANAWGINDLIIDGQNGLLVPFGQPAELAQAMRKLLEDHALARLLGTSGRTQTLPHHLWSIKLPVIEAALNKLAVRVAAESSESGKES